MENRVFTAKILIKILKIITLMSFLLFLESLK